jgi:hypothetical protein
MKILLEKFMAVQEEHWSEVQKQGSQISDQLEELRRRIQQSDYDYVYL